MDRTYTTPDGNPSSGNAPGGTPEEPTTTAHDDPLNLPPQSPDSPFSYRSAPEPQRAIIERLLLLKAVAMTLRDVFELAGANYSAHFSSYTQIIDFVGDEIDGLVGAMMGEER